MCLIFNCCLLKTTFGTHTETSKKKTHTHIHTSSSSHQLSVLTQADEVPDDKEHSLSNKQASSSSQPNAPHPAALTKAQQKLVDEIRTFGRLPKQNMGDSAEDQFENKLYPCCEL